MIRRLSFAFLLVLGGCATRHVLFDDFNYAKPEDVAQHGWIIRTETGWPGVQVIGIGGVVAPQPTSVWQPDGVPAAMSSEKFSPLAVIEAQLFLMVSVQVKFALGQRLGPVHRCPS